MTNKKNSKLVDLIFNEIPKKERTPKLYQITRFLNKESCDYEKKILNQYGSFDKFVLELKELVSYDMARRNFVLGTKSSEIYGTTKGNVLRY